MLACCLNESNGIRGPDPNNSNSVTPLSIHEGKWFRVKGVKLLNQLLLEDLYTELELSGVRTP